MMDTTILTYIRTTLNIAGPLAVSEIEVFARFIIPTRQSSRFYLCNPWMFWGSDVGAGPSIFSAPGLPHGKAPGRRRVGPSILLQTKASFFYSPSAVAGGLLLRPAGNVVRSFLFYCLAPPSCRSIRL